MKNIGIGIPKLRFPGFTGAWEQRKLGEVTQSYSGGTPLAGNSEYYGGDIPFIRSAEINSDTTELFLTQIGLKKSSAKIVEIGDILYALYGATSGEVGISRINGAINQAVLAIQTKDGFDSYFIMQWLRLQKQKIVDKYLQGGQGNLSGSIVKELVIFFPNYEEQQQISTFFKQLDNLITLHQRRLEHLKKMKSGLLQKMFPKIGEVVPEFRFPGFTDAWEQRKVSSVSKSTYGGGTPKTNIKKFWNGTIPWIQSSDLEINRLFNISPKKHITNESVQKSATKLVPSDSIAIVTRVGVGKLALMTFEYTTSQDFLSLSDLQVDSYFGIYSLYIMLQKELNALQGTSIKGITKLDLLDKELMIPKKVNEQKKIGTFFKQLDNLITLHQRKLDHLQSMKKGLLQQMFV